MTDSAAPPSPPPQEISDTQKTAIERLDEDVDRDAARYRWLRTIGNQGAKERDGSGPLVVVDSPSKTPRYIGPLWGDDLDAAIDAAMKGKP